MKKVKDENQTIMDFLQFSHFYELIDKTLYNDKDEIIDKNKTLKYYGFYNGDRVKLAGLYIGGGPFTENIFFDNIVISDLIKEKNESCMVMYSPSKSMNGPIRLEEEMSFDVIGSNIGPVFGGKQGRYSLDSNVCKAAVFEGLINVGQKAIVFLKIVKNTNYFEGDTKNGITTSDFRYISDLCFIFGEAKSEEEYYHPKTYLVKIEKKK